MQDAMSATTVAPGGVAFDCNWERAVLAAASFKNDDWE